MAVAPTVCLNMIVRDEAHVVEQTLAGWPVDDAWVIDADDLVVGDIDLSRLTADSYLLRYRADFHYWRKQLFRAELPWRYVGAVHEYRPATPPPARSA